MGYSTDCGHASNCEHANRAAESLDLTSLENCEELIERESFNCIVQAQGNWLARLATTVLSVSQGHDTTGLPSSICWECVKSKHRGTTTYIY